MNEYKNKIQYEKDETVIKVIKNLLSKGENNFVECVRIYRSHFKVILAEAIKEVRKLS